MSIFDPSRSKFYLYSRAAYPASLMARFYTGKDMEPLHASGTPGDTQR